MGKRLTEQVIESRLNEIYLGKYQFIKRDGNEIYFKCPVHGVVHERIDHILTDKRGCKFCNYDEMNKAYDTKSFIRLAKRYSTSKLDDFSKVNYTKSDEYVTIICKKHGEYRITPNSYLNGCRCNKCKGENTAKRQLKSQNAVISQLQKSYRKFPYYSFEKVDYKGESNDIVITCHNKDSNGVEHGDFIVNAGHALRRGDGCPKCRKEKEMNQEKVIEFVHKIHGDAYLTDKVQYVNYDTPITLYCKKHGIDFSIKIGHLKAGEGCPLCRYEKSAASKRRTLEDVIKLSNEIHNNQYDYSLIKEYKNDRITYPIICHKKDKNGKEHGVFYKSFNLHIQGKQGCPICKSSKLENDVRSILQANGIKFEQQKKFNDIKNEKPLPFDFYLPDYNTVIECQGIQHFKSIPIFGGFHEFAKTRQRDKLKYDGSLNKGIKIIYYTNENYDKMFNESTIKNADDLIRKIKTI